MISGNHVTHLQMCVLHNHVALQPAVIAIWHEIVTFATKYDNGDVLVLTASDIGQ